MLCCFMLKSKYNSNKNCQNKEKNEYLKRENKKEAVMPTFKILQRIHYTVKAERNFIKFIEIICKAKIKKKIRQNNAYVFEKMFNYYCAFIIIS